MEKETCKFSYETKRKHLRVHMKLLFIFKGNTRDRQTTPESVEGAEGIWDPPEYSTFSGPSDLDDILHSSGRFRVDEILRKTCNIP